MSTSSPQLTSLPLTSLPPTGEIEAGSRRRSPLWLIAILIVYAAYRAPFVLKQLGGQDEQWFSPPGLTVAREGIPRIPFYPARHPDSFYYRADEAMFALPPGLFYLQAPFFLVLPPGYPTARWPSFVAGAIAICLVYELARRAAGRSAGLWAAGFYAISRILFFTSTMARPDQLCATFGLAALLLVWNYHDARRPRSLVAAGVALGLGLLCHPFAVVFCLFCGIWTLVIPAPLGRRLTAATVLTATTLALFALWLLLIIPYREIFEHQFFNNVLRPAGPGMTRRLLWPWPYVPHQWKLLSEQAGIWQSLFMLLALAVATLRAWRHGARPEERRLVIIVWGSLYLLTAIQGHHPTKGYLCFTGALLFATAASCVAPAMHRLARKSRLAATLLGMAVIAAFLPQAGLRTWWAQIRPGTEDRYDGPEFTRRLIAELPADARYLLDPEFVFDFWLAGRNVSLRANPQEFLLDRQPYDFLIVSRDGLRKEIPQLLKGELVRSFGHKDDPLACYAEVYRPQATVIHPGTP